MDLCHCCEWVADSCHQTRWALGGLFTNLDKFVQTVIAFVQTALLEALQPTSPPQTLYKYLDGNSSRLLLHCRLENLNIPHL